MASRSGGGMGVTVALVISILLVLTLILTNMLFYTKKDQAEQQLAEVENAVRSIIRDDERDRDWVKKLKNEAELVKRAIEEGVRYGEARGAVEFEPTDSAAEKIEYIYRLLVHDRMIQPLPEDQVSQKAMRHKLAIWASKLK